LPQNNITIYLGSIEFQNFYLKNKNYYKMGKPEYSLFSRSVRAESLGYKTKSADQIFTQNKEKTIHESMKPQGIKLRESRDSVNHPLSAPIVLGLDVTGSMGSIPHYLVKSGLPNLMQKIIDKGILDPQILFLAIGDHICDKYPLQVGQFESGDEELDMWLTRTYIEKGGGANEGESYHLAWYFAGNFTETDAWDKRKQKGLLFTTGDEPCLNSLPASVVKELMENDCKTDYTIESLLQKAREKYEVYHLHILEGSAGQRSQSFWKDLLGQNCVLVEHHEKLDDVIAEIVFNHFKSNVSIKPKPSPSITSPDEGFKPTIML
jgi:hypothetical protein